MKEIQQNGLQSESHYEAVLENVKHDVQNAFDSLNRAFHPVVEDYQPNGLYHPPTKAHIHRHLSDTAAVAKHKN